jgi:dTDP-4-dehydrorhamnose 3,5-epimerase
MKIIQTALAGVVVIEPRVFSDPRGHFLETYHRTRYREAGIDAVFVQDNLSFSVRGTLRGLHFQVTRPQAKLVQVITGEVFDVAVDIRPGSSSFGNWIGEHLSAQNHRQMFIPPGFAHGFCVLSQTAHFLYKCSELYAPKDEGGILWSDPDIGIHWPVNDPIVSEKDAAYPGLFALNPQQLFNPESQRENRP